MNNFRVSSLEAYSHNENWCASFFRWGIRREYVLTESSCTRFVSLLDRLLANGVRCVKSEYFYHGFGIKVHL